MSHNLKLGASWAEVKERLKEIEITLSDTDLEYEPGQEDALLYRLSQKLGMGLEEIKGWIESVSFNEGKAS